MVAALLAACNPFAWTTESAAAGDQLQGRLLLWHDWEGRSGQTLARLIDQFREVNPGVTIISIATPADEMVPSFIEFARGGLGPDLVLTDAGNISKLADARLVRNLSGRSEVDLERFLPGPLSTVQRNNSLYGLPFAMHTQVLFYNRERVTQTPETLDALVEQVEGGATLGLSTELVDGFWGTRAFGGRLIDDEGNLALNEGGFLNWVDFLKSLQGLPGIVLDRNYAPLRTRFVAGELDFLVGSSLDVPYLQEALSEQGTGELGVAMLPSGSNARSAGPVLRVDAFGFSRATSQSETRLALAFVSFLTNTQQQSRLVAEPIGRLPVLSQIRYRLNLPESVNQLARQSRTAIPIPMEHVALWDRLADVTSNVRAIYTQALAGALSSQQAVATITRLLAEQYDLPIKGVSNEQFCPLEGELDLARPVELVLWHSLEGAEADALNRIGGGYEQICPGVSLVFEYVNGEDIATTYREALEDGEGPDMLLESSRLTPRLAGEQLIRDLSDIIEPEFLQQFIPGAEAAMRYDRRLFGLPESVEVLALYRNTDLAPEALYTLEEIPLRVSGDHPFSMPANFFYGFWGVQPFGGFEFNPNTGALLETEGLRNWLSWLRSQQAQPGVILDLDWEDAEDRFANGEAAYLVSGPWSLARLREELGAERLRVTPLPSGRLGPGSPILQVQGLMVNAKIPDRKAELAIAFGRYLTSAASQSILLETRVHVSALVNIELSEYPLLNGFREQAKLATVVTENANFAVIEGAGDVLYREVLAEGAVLAGAMADFVERVHDENGITPEAVEEE